MPSRVTGDEYGRCDCVRIADAPDAFGTTLAEDDARSDREWRARAGCDDDAHVPATTIDGSCLGIAVGARYSDYIDTACLFGMWVAPEYRGRKVGIALAEAVIAWARNENYKRIVLDVADTNAAAIRRSLKSGHFFEDAAEPTDRTEVSDTGVLRFDAQNLGCFGIRQFFEMPQCQNFAIQRCKTLQGRGELL